MTTRNMEIEKSTRDIAEEISQEFGSEFELDRRDLTLAVDKALRDRDERAAKIAESFSTEIHFENADVNDIASAIRGKS